MSAVTLVARLTTEKATKYDGHACQGTESKVWIVGSERTRTLLKYFDALDQGDCENYRLDQEDCDNYGHGRE